MLKCRHTCIVHTSGAACLAAYFNHKYINLLHVPFTTTAIGRKAFSFAAPTVWNSIPLSIRQSPSIGSFKRHLKTHLFTLPSQSISPPSDTSASDSSMLEFVRYTIFLIIVIIIIQFNVIKLQLMTLFSKLNLELAVTKYSSH